LVDVDVNVNYGVIPKSPVCSGAIQTEVVSQTNKALVPTVLRNDLLGRAIRARRLFVDFHCQPTAASNQLDDALCEGQGGDRTADGGHVAKRIALPVHQAH
jgi:hypothetical protein